MMVTAWRISEGEMFPALIQWDAMYGAPYQTVHPMRIPIAQ